jgi:hypothetical protein
MNSTTTYQDYKEQISGNMPTINTASPKLSTSPRKFPKINTSIKRHNFIEENDGLGSPTKNGMMSTKQFVGNRSHPSTQHSFY